MSFKEVSKVPTPSEIGNMKRRLRKLEKEYDDLRYQFKDHIDKEDFEVLSVDDFLKLKELYMGEWKEMYEPEDCIVNDGANWQLTMEFTHPNETVIIRGNNAYPYNFDEFLSIFDAEHFIDEDAYREGFWNIK
jgi:hypothetical protein